MAPIRGIALDVEMDRICFMRDDVNDLSKLAVVRLATAPAETTTGRGARGMLSGKNR